MCIIDSILEIRNRCITHLFIHSHRYIIIIRVLYDICMSLMDCVLLLHVAIFSVTVSVRIKEVWWIQSEAGSKRTEERWTSGKCHSTVGIIFTSNHFSVT